MFEHNRRIITNSDCACNSEHDQGVSSLPFLSNDKSTTSKLLSADNVTQPPKGNAIDFNDSFVFDIVSSTQAKRGYSLLQGETLRCSSLSKTSLSSLAVKNTLMITVCDKLIWESFGPSWIEAVERAGIQYWVVVALDVETSIAAAKYRVDHYFESPMIANEALSTINYHWGSDHWKKRTWDKVRVVNAIYLYGFHMIHSDTDTSWFRDPLPFFEAHRNEPYDIMIFTDLTITFNPINVTDMEFATDPHMNINTGIYLLRQSSSGKSLLRSWLDVIELNPAVGHDQDGFNLLVRGDYFRGDKKYGRAMKIPSVPYFSSAFNASIFVSLLPSSSFANTYAFCNAASYKRLGHDLLAGNCVWGDCMKESRIFWF